MAFDNLAQMVAAFAQQMDDQETLSVPLLSGQFRRHSEADPTDATMRSLASVLGKMEDHGTNWIKKSELQKLYSKLYSRGTRVAELFGKELGLTSYSPEIKRQASEIHRDLDTSKYGDQVLSNALDSVFSNAPLKEFSKEAGKIGVNLVSRALDAWHLPPVKVSIANGNTSCLLVQADFETPKGKTSMFLPLEVSENKVLPPTFFMGNSGTQELNHANIKSYLLSHAGEKLKASGTAVLSLITKLAVEKREVSDVELALTNLRAKRSGQGEFAGQIIGQKIASASIQPDLLPRHKDTDSFAEQLSTPAGSAEMTLGKAKVAQAREHLSREMKGFGHQAQISILGHDSNSLRCGVTCQGGKIAFTVPVKFVSGKMQKPMVLLCNGSVSPFSAKGIASLIAEEKSDFKVAAAASPMYSLKPSDLVNIVRTAMVEENKDKALDALNILQQSGDDVAYTVAFQAFMQGLSGKTAEVKKECSMQRKSSTSEQMICGHTGLPVSKVFIDKHGSCRPLYRQGQAESYEGAFFSTAKILAG
jgi:hypothetical protein